MFKSYLKVRQVTDDEWELIEPLVYDAGRFGIITVPAGFTCDFCSVPRVPFAYWMAGGLAEGAGVVHDYLYRVGTIDRESADRVFYTALRDLGVPPWKAGLMYKAVRMFAGRIWNAYRRKDK